MDENTTYKCVFCNGELRVDSTEDCSERSDDYDEDDGAVITNMTCTQCGRSYEIWDPTGFERDTDYKEYWDK